MKPQKFFALRSYFHDQCLNQKITWEQFISANYLLQTVQLNFANIKPPEIKLEENLILRWCKEENYLELGINSVGLFSFRVFFASLDSEGHIGFGKEYFDGQSHAIFWPLIWADEKRKKYLEYFLE